MVGGSALFTARMEFYISTGSGVAQADPARIEAHPIERSCERAPDSGAGATGQDRGWSGGTRPRRSASGSFAMWLGASALFASAQWMERTAVGWLVLDATGSVFLTALAWAVRSAPSMIMGPLAGALPSCAPRRGGSPDLTGCFGLGARREFSREPFCGPVGVSSGRAERDHRQPSRCGTPYGERDGSLRHEVDSSLCVWDGPRGCAGTVVRTWRCRRATRDPRSDCPAISSFRCSSWTNSLMS